MGKQVHPRKTKKLQDVVGNDSVLQNKVHALIAYIESHYSKEDQFKRSFATAALTGALRFLDEISKAEGVSTKKKIELLTEIYETANRKIEQLADESPDAIPLWEERPKTHWRMSPCRFVELNYPTYGKGLTSDDIKDRKLLRALWNYKTRYGWPADFKLLGRSEALDHAVSTEGARVDLKGLTDEPPHVRRLRERLYRAKRRRMGPNLVR